LSALYSTFYVCCSDDDREALLGMLSNFANNNDECAESLFAYLACDSKETDGKSEGLHHYQRDFCIENVSEVRDYLVVEANLPLSVGYELSEAFLSALRIKSSSPVYGYLHDSQCGESYLWRFDEKLQFLDSDSELFQQVVTLNDGLSHSAFLSGLLDDSSAELGIWKDEYAHSSKAGSSEGDIVVKELEGVLNFDISQSVNFDGDPADLSEVCWLVLNAAHRDRKTGNESQMYLLVRTEAGDRVWSLRSKGSKRELFPYVTNFFSELDNKPLSYALLLVSYKEPWGVNKGQYHYFEAGSSSLDRAYHWISPYDSAIELLKKPVNYGVSASRLTANLGNGKDVFVKKKLLIPLVMLWLSILGVFYVTPLWAKLLISLWGVAQLPTLLDRRDMIQMRGDVIKIPALEQPVRLEDIECFYFVDDEKKPLMLRKKGDEHTWWIKTKGLNCDKAGLQGLVKEFAELKHIKVWEDIDWNA